MADSDFTPEELASEEWRPIVGAEDFYAVSNLGRVKRTARGKSTFPGKILAAKRDSSGYRQVRLCLGARGDYRLALVHHAVYGAFVGARPSDTEVNHIDGDKLNNRIGNLEIVTHARNMGHASEVGLMSRGEGHFGATLTDTKAADAKRLLMTGLGPRPIADLLGVDPAVIWGIATGRTWRHVCVEGFVPVDSVKLPIGRGRESMLKAWATTPEKFPHGERSPNAKLTEAAVREIRLAHASGETQASISKRYGVSQPAVGCVIRRRTWKHVK